jgi:hypothetical protein
MAFSQDEKVFSACHDLLGRVLDKLATETEDADIGSNLTGATELFEATEKLQEKFAIAYNALVDIREEEGLEQESERSRKKYQ